MQKVGILSSSFNPDSNDELEQILKDSFSDTRRRYLQEGISASLETPSEKEEFLIEATKTFFLELSVRQVEAMSINFVRKFIKNSSESKPHQPINFVEISAKRKNRK